MQTHTHTHDIIYIYIYIIYIYIYIYTHTYIYIYTHTYSCIYPIIYPLNPHYITILPPVYPHRASGLCGSVTEGAVCLVIVAWQCFKWPGFQATVTVPLMVIFEKNNQNWPTCARNEDLNGFHQRTSELQLLLLVGLYCHPPPQNQWRRVLPGPGWRVPKRRLHRSWLTPSWGKGTGAKRHGGGGWELGWAPWELYFLRDNLWVLVQINVDIQCVYIYI